MNKSMFSIILGAILGSLAALLLMNVLGDQEFKLFSLLVQISTTLIFTYTFALKIAEEQKK